MVRLILPKKTSIKYHRPLFSKIMTRPTLPKKTTIKYYNKLSLLSNEITTSRKTTAKYHNQLSPLTNRTMTRSRRAKTNCYRLLSSLTGYRAYKRSLIKDNNAKILLKYAQNHLKHVNAVLLDGPHLFTSDILLKNNIVKNIYVPECDKDTYKQQILSGKRLSHHNMYLNDFINTDHIKSINFAYFDYFCTVTGNKNINPKKDITDFLKNTTQDKLVLGCTFSPRAKKGVFKSASMFASHIIMECINNSNFEIIEKKEPLSYKSFHNSSPMLFLAFVIERR